MEISASGRAVAAVVEIWLPAGWTGFGSVGEGCSIFSITLMDGV